jgi:hypothetical protein
MGRLPSPFLAPHRAADEVKGAASSSFSSVQRGMRAARRAEPPATGHQWSRSPPNTAAVRLAPQRVTIQGDAVGLLYSVDH